MFFFHKHLCPLRRNIVNVRVGAELRHKLYRVFGIHQSIYFTLAVVEVSKYTCPLMTRAHAVGLLALGEKVSTEGTLLRYPQSFMECPRAIWAGHDTCPAANAFILIYVYYAVLPLR
jgi:hypothetical protein